MASDQKIMRYKMAGYMVPDRGMIKTPAQTAGIRKAGAANTEILNRVDSIVKAGISTEEINELVYRNTLELGGIPVPLNYDGFPKSACTSVNDVVCHGIPSAECILKDGDTINMDVTIIVDSYYGDAPRMYCTRNMSNEARKLVEMTKKCTDSGLREVKPWGHPDDIDAVISECAYQNGSTVVREIGGYGVDAQFHEEPWVSHIGTGGADMLLVPGMIFTIEPMINAGGEETFQDEEDDWAIYTGDGSLTTQ